MSSPLHLERQDDGAYGLDDDRPRFSGGDGAIDWPANKGNKQGRRTGSKNLSAGT
jgi:hypothetical protein